MNDKSLHIELFGDFRLAYGNQPLKSVHTPRLQALIAYLILHRRAPQLRQYISFLFWSDTTEKQAQTNLRQLLYHLKAALPDYTRYIHIDHKTLQWKPESHCTIDVARFEKAIAKTRKKSFPDHKSSLRQMLESAINCYKGDLLPSCYDEWIMHHRTLYREEYNWALEQLLNLLEEEGDYPAAIKYGHRLLQQDELRESVYCRLMRLYASQHDRAEALRVYRHCSHILSQELGIKPGAEAQSLYYLLMQEA